ncbi:hypothetical protein PINS_up001262 [Pythium insidiosum]|nr:hypothetical protein PINS_up001262 [Pythium insidiosum]
MGICRSTCAPAHQLEYYGPWHREQPILGRRRTAVVRSAGHPSQATRVASHHRRTKLWTCDRGCCSIRWKLDYAEFQSYSKYAEVSPYVVVQENHAGCGCVICKGLPEQFLQCRVDQIRRATSATPSETDDDDDDVVTSSAPTSRRRESVLSPVA